VQTQSQSINSNISVSPLLTVLYQTPLRYYFFFHAPPSLSFAVPHHRTVRGLGRENSDILRLANLLGYWQYVGLLCETGVGRVSCKKVPSTCGLDCLARRLEGPKYVLSGEKPSLLWIIPTPGILTCHASLSLCGRLVPQVETGHPNNTPRACVGLTRGRDGSLAISMDRSCQFQRSFLFFPFRKASWRWDRTMSDLFLFLLFPLISFTYTRPLLAWRLWNFCCTLVSTIWEQSKCMIVDFGIEKSRGSNVLKLEGWKKTGWTNTPVVRLLQGTASIVLSISSRSCQILFYRRLLLC
jgi:hypothetical protein